MIKKKAEGGGGQELAVFFLFSTKTSFCGTARGKKNDAWSIESVAPTFLVGISNIFLPPADNDDARVGSDSEIATTTPLALPKGN